MELLSKLTHNLFTTDGVIDFSVSCIYVPRFEPLREEVQATRLRPAKKEHGAVGELQSISITTYCVARKFTELLILTEILVRAKERVYAKLLRKQ